MEKIRLQKFFTDNKIMSRRNAEKVIEAGNVKVNGVIAKLGDKVDPENDTVTYNGKIIKNSAEKKRYIMLNKPLGYVSTVSDEKADRPCLTLFPTWEKEFIPLADLICIPRDFLYSPTTVSLLTDLPTRRTTCQRCTA